jgi:hypothetical protein
VIALGRLGWSLRRIEEATGVRRETAGEYLRRAGVAIRPVGSWGEKSLAKAATQVTTGSGEEAAKPAIAVTTGFFTEKAPAKGSASASEPYREGIAQELGRGRNAMVKVTTDEVAVGGAPLGSIDTSAYCPKSAVGTRPGTEEEVQRNRPAPGNTTTRHWNSLEVSQQKPDSRTQP